MKKSLIIVLGFSGLLLGLTPCFATERVVFGEMFTSTE